MSINFRNCHHLDLPLFYEGVKTVTAASFQKKHKIEVTFDRLIRERYAGIWGLARRSWDTLGNFCRGQGFCSYEPLAAELLEKMQVKENCFKRAFHALFGRTLRHPEDGAVLRVDQLEAPLELEAYIALFSQKTGTKHVQLVGKERYQFIPREKSFEYLGCPIVLENFLTIHFQREEKRVDFTGIKVPFGGLFKYVSYCNDALKIGVKFPLVGIQEFTI